MEADSLATESELRTLAEDKIRAEGEKKRLLMQISDAEAAGTEAETQKNILEKAISDAENRISEYEKLLSERTERKNALLSDVSEIEGKLSAIGEKEAENVAKIAKTEEDRVIILPVEKDDTDMLAAIKLGLSEGYRSFRIYGGMGGRIEHTIANIQCLLYLKEHDAVGYLMDGTGMILVAKEEEISFQDSLEGYMSLFSMGDKATVTIENMKYLLKEQEVTNSFPIGISNEFVLGEKGKVTVHEGSVMMIVSWV